MPQDNTSSFENTISTEDFASESRTVAPINDDAAHRRPDIEEARAPAPEKEEAPKAPIDPRKERMDEVVAKNNERRAAELAAIDATLVRQETQPAVAPEPRDDDYIDLKVRKQTTRMTARERNEILRDDFDDVDIKGMTETERNRQAQMILANRSYKDELDAIKSELKKPTPAAQPAQVVVQDPVAAKAPIDAARERLDAALQALEYGEEGAREKVSTAHQELARIEAQAVFAENERTTKENVIDQDIRAGFSLARQDWLEKYPDLVNDQVVIGSLQASVPIGFRRLIGEAINTQPQHIKDAFLTHGVTPEFVAHAPDEEIKALYKDMIVKGYTLPQPSRVIRAVAETIASRFAGNTPPVNAGQHHNPDGQNGRSEAVLDRSDRKEGIRNQPGRASMPRTSTNANQPQLSETERAKATRDAEKLKRRGRAVQIR